MLNNRVQNANWCNLECVKDKEKGGDEVLEFVGPVKIVLVDQPRSAYLCKTWYAAAIVMAQMMMASVIILVMFYSSTFSKKTFFKALHMFLSTVGLQALIPSGVLSLNNLSGPTIVMKIPDRKIEHLFLEILGLVCAVGGTVAAFYSEFPVILSIHSIFGIAASGLAGLSAITGIIYFVLFGQNLSTEVTGTCGSAFRIFHRILGILTLFSSSGCFVCGIIKSCFVKWLPHPEMFYFIIVFSVFYTFIVAYKPLKELSD